MRRALRSTLLAAAMALLSIASAHAATLRFKPRSVVTGGLVRLDDVADVLDADSATTAKLAAVTLAPAPGPGAVLKLGHEAIRSRLSAQGIDVSQIGFTGRSVVTVKSEGAATARALPALPSEVVRRKLEREVSERIAEYLEIRQPGPGPVDVKPALTAEHFAALTSKSCTFKITAGAPPWTGSQTFAVEIYDGLKRLKSLPLECVVAPRASLVHLVRPVRRGQILGELDVELRAVADSRQPAELKPGLTSLSAAVGCEALRNLYADEVLCASDVKKVTLVHRNSIVTVASRVGNIVVSAEAKARTEGGLGDTVELISMDGKQRYTGRVVGFHEVRTDPVKQPVTQLRVVPELADIK